MSRILGLEQRPGGRVLGLYQVGVRGPEAGAVLLRRSMFPCGVHREGHTPKPCGLNDGLFGILGFGSGLPYPRYEGPGDLVPGSLSGGMPHQPSNPYALPNIGGGGGGR